MKTNVLVNLGNRVRVDWDQPPAPQVANHLCQSFRVQAGLVEFTPHIIGLIHVCRGELPVDFTAERRWRVCLPEVNGYGSRLDFLQPFFESPDLQLIGKAFASCFVNQWKARDLTEDLVQILSPQPLKPKGGPSSLSSFLDQKSSHGIVAETDCE